MDTGLSNKTYAVLYYNAKRKPTLTANGTFSGLSVTGTNRIGNNTVDIVIS